MSSIVLASCQPIVSTTTEAHSKIVVNSTWHVVRTETFDLSKSLESDVAVYNATHTDDQQFVYVATVPPVEQSPNATVYIVNPKTHEIYQEFSDNYTENTANHGPAIPRTQLISNVEGWRLQAIMVGGVLYVDNIPPLGPEAPDLRSLDEKYVIYALDSAGHIVYSTHCYDPEVADHDTESEAQSFIAIVEAGYNLEIALGNASSIVKGHYYIDPTI